MKALRATFLAVLLMGQQGPAQATWQTFTSADNLGQGQVRVFFEDRAGNLWAGTDGGASRYDGLRWITFTSRDSIAGNDVLAIHEDTRGNLWFGTNGGVSRYDGSTFTNYRAPDSLPANRVEGITEDRAGNLWFRTSAGVARFDGVHFTRFTTDDSLVDNAVTAEIADRSGSMWFGTEHGLSRYSGAWTSFSAADLQLGSDRISALVEDGMGGIWAATRRGASRYDPATSRWTSYADSLIDIRVLTMVLDPAMNVWFGTEGGASRYDGTWKHFTTGDGLLESKVSSMFADRSSALWFWGTTERGISRYSGRGWSRFSSPSDGLAANNITAMFQDRRGNFWFGFGLPGGVTRFDGERWTSHGVPPLPTADVRAVAEDRNGRIWVGTATAGADSGGAVVFDGSTWGFADSLGRRTVSSIHVDRRGGRWFGTFSGVFHDDGRWERFTASSSPLVDNHVNAIAEDRLGGIWFGTSNGVSRYDPDSASWRTFQRPAVDLADNRVHAILEDKDGVLWFGTENGVSRYDGGWTTFRSPPLASAFVTSLALAKDGAIWIGSSGQGLTRHDRGDWKVLDEADGWNGGAVTSLHVDSGGNLWIGILLGGGGVQRYDGERWTSWGTADGLAGQNVNAIFDDRFGNLWFATGDGLSLYEPDRVPPTTLVTPRPPALSASTTQTISFAAAFGETRGIQFSYHLDGPDSSRWSPDNFLLAEGLRDGIHTFSVRARDRLGNVDSIPVALQFEIDATPPASIISSPRFGDAVAGDVSVTGTASDDRFENFALEFRAVGAEDWTLLAESTRPAVDTVLAHWATSSLPDGDYDLKLSVGDLLGLTGVAQAAVIVDNQAPYADRTTPARVTAALGGDVFTTQTEVHLYFPPHGFSEDARVLVKPVSADSVPATLPDGARLVLPGYDISWVAFAAGTVAGKVTLEKPGTLALSWATRADPPAGGLALYFRANGGADYRLVGGTFEASARRIVAAIREPGRYALFTQGTSPMGAASLSTLSLTPRVFSPRGTFANREIAIGFTLGRPGTVTVRVYSRSGRLIREVTSGQAMGAGANLVRWDGHDRDGAVIEDGLYLVSVEALGEKRTQTLAVVR